ncbi:MAG: hypothetical protein H6636_00910 [Anaerolineales bacterium]|nr:hypothetical protein [Anaerolineales bacterium]
MEQEHLLILDLLDEGKITVPEALELLAAMDASVEEDTLEPTLTVQFCLN